VCKSWANFHFWDLLDLKIIDNDSGFMFDWEAPAPHRLPPQASCWWMWHAVTWSQSLWYGADLQTSSTLIYSCRDATWKDMESDGGGVFAEASDALIQTHLHIHTSAFLWRRLGLCSEVQMLAYLPDTAEQLCDYPI